MVYGVDFAGRRAAADKPIDKPRPSGFHLSVSMSQTQSQLGKNRVAVRAIRAAIWLMVAGMFFACWDLIFAPSRRAQVHESEPCGSRIKKICLEANMWAIDNQTNILPSTLHALSNQLVGPGIFRCPKDPSRAAATSWAGFSADQSSYEIIAPRLDINATNPYLRCRVHGHVGYADGRLEFCPTKR